MLQIATLFYQMQHAQEQNLLEELELLDHMSTMVYNLQVHLILLVSVVFHGLVLEYYIHSYIQVFVIDETWFSKKKEQNY